MAYFGPRYFLGGPTAPATPPPPTGSADLLAAVKAYWLTTGLPALFTGGLYLGKAARAATAPYCEYEDLTSHTSFTTASSLVLTTRLRFRAIAPDGDLAADLAVSLQSAFEGVRLSFAGGVTGPFVLDQVRHPTNGSGAGTVAGGYAASGYDASGNDLWEPYVDFTVRVRRSY